MENPRNKPGKRTVHIYYVVRVSITGIEAQNDKDAIIIAENTIDPYRLTYDEKSSRISAGYAEDVDSVMIDHEGDEEHKHTTTYISGPDGWKDGRV